MRRGQARGGLIDTFSEVWMGPLIVSGIGAAFAAIGVGAFLPRSGGDDVA